MTAVWFSRQALLFVVVFAASIKRGFSQTQCMQENTQCMTRWQGMGCTTDCVEDSIFTCLRGLCQEGQNCTCKLERFTSGCTQTDTCISRRGSCVVGCVPSDTFDCLPNLCTESQYCMCKAPKACPNTAPCIDKGGVCDASCVATDPTIQCLDGLCTDTPGASPCKCKITTPKCPQTTVCADRGGVCDNDCVPSTDGTSVVCLDGCSLAPDFPNCKCKVVKHVPSPSPTRAPNQDCPTTDKCSFFGGKCLFKCAPTPGTTEVCMDWCDSRACQCLVRNDCPQTPTCKERGGRCEIGCAPSPDGTIQCLDICDKAAGCFCKVVTPTPTLAPTRHPVLPGPTPAPTKAPNQDCPTTDKCSFFGGKCLFKCAPTPGTTEVCMDWCDSRACQCLVRNDCQQTPSCKERGGRCEIGCSPSPDGTIQCLDICDKAAGCLCKVVTPTPTLAPTRPPVLPGSTPAPTRAPNQDCPTTDKCSFFGGKCLFKCAPTPGTTEMCMDWCDSRACQCLVRNDCQLTPSCKERGGRCEIGCAPSTDGTIQCLDLCDKAAGCLCKVVTPKPTLTPTRHPVLPGSTPAPTRAPNQDCPTTDKCTSFGGKCLFKCAPTPGTTEMCMDWCDSKDCQCLVRNDCQQTQGCKERGGRCEIGCAPSTDGTIQCLDICDKTTGCLCKVVTSKLSLSPTEAPAKPSRPSKTPTRPPSPRPTKKPKKCTQTNTPCRLQWKGLCNSNCFDNSTHVCHKNLCKEKFCKCQIKRGSNKGCGKSKACAKKSGTCVVGCVPSYKVDCLPGLCSSATSGSVCSCQVKRKVCQQAKVDWQCGTPYTQCQPSNKPLCVCDIDTESNQFCWNNDWCAESEQCTSSLDCPSGKRCASSCCGRTCLPECGEGGIGIDYRRRRLLENEVEETENRLNLRGRLEAGANQTCELSAAGNCCDSQCRP